MVLYDNMPDLSREEYKLFKTLTDIEQAAYLIARDTNKCAHKRMTAVTVLPLRALVLIDNEIAHMELRNRA